MGWLMFPAFVLFSFLWMIVAFPLAWGIARRGVGRAVLFPLVVNLRALPLIIFAIPLYMMYSVAGLLDTRLGLGLILAVVNLPLALISSTVSVSLMKSPPAPTSA